MRFILNINRRKKTSFFSDTEKEVEHTTNGNTKTQPTIATESIEFDNGLKLDLSSIDDDTSDPNIRRRSIDFDFEAINRSNSRIGDWETNFTLVESKVRFLDYFFSSIILYFLIVISFR